VVTIRGDGDDGATFVLIHGGGDVGWYWHLVERELRQRGHDTLATDLPCDDDSAGLRAMPTRTAEP
jgi:pimeloyl-ACP methyl ester carboxylesterase